MAEGYRQFLSAWDDVRTDVEEYRELDGGRVLVFTHTSGRGKASGLELGPISATTAVLFQLRRGKVTRLGLYWDRDRALADLGLASERSRELQRHPHIETIERYYGACSLGDVAGVAACCTNDVVHYFLPPGMKPVYGNEHLGRYWRKVVELIGAEWWVEHAIASEDEAVIEWSMQWTSPEDRQRHVWHGAEWYDFRDGLICEIRAYYDYRNNEDTGLVGFPYAERGYTVIAPAADSDA
jgi:ketosteroid isomerase-like protein